MNDWKGNADREVHIETGTLADAQRARHVEDGLVISVLDLKVGLDERTPARTAIIVYMYVIYKWTVYTNITECVERDLPMHGVVRE